MFTRSVTLQSSTIASRSNSMRLGTLRAVRARRPDCSSLPADKRARVIIGGGVVIDAAKHEIVGGGICHSTQFMYELFTRAEALDR